MKNGTGKGPAVPIPFNKFQTYKEEINKIDNKVTEYYTKNLLNREKSCIYALKTVIGNLKN